MPLGDRKLAMHELGRLPAHAYATAQRRPVRLVLDNVRSRHNVGALFRTADAFGLEGLDLCGLTPRPPHREIEKTALGATLSVPWQGHADTLSAVQGLLQKGYTLVGVEQTELAIPLQRWLPEPMAPLALVLGNELSGVADDVVAACSACIVVPQHGSKHSLNVGVCAGIVLWQALRPMP
jgi:23S rRNA (guanosine2251-2'-O)-methyltransferase